jgi:hypothetical protein
VQRSENILFLKGIAVDNSYMYENILFLKGIAVDNSYMYDGVN